jgi:hypothetical protein
MGDTNRLTASEADAGEPAAGRTHADVQVLPVVTQEHIPFRTSHDGAPTPLGFLERSIDHDRAGARDGDQRVLAGRAVLDDHDRSQCDESQRRHGIRMGFQRQT